MDTDRRNCRLTEPKKGEGQTVNAPMNPLEVSSNRGTPEIIHFNGIFHYKPWVNQIGVPPKSSILKNFKEFSIFKS